MLQNHIGEFAALLTAFFWTITALAFEYASNKVGSLIVNFLRLLLAFIFLSFYSWISRGHILPTDATSSAWLWLSLSGLIGFVIGDLFLFESYTIIGSRISMLIMTLVPPITAIFSWFILDETMSLLSIFGMIITVGGILIVIVSRKNGGKKIFISHSLKGLLYAFIGSVGQSFGLIFSKVGMGSYNAFAATQIRIVTGIIGFFIIITLLGKWKNVNRAFFNKDAMKRITLGSFFGPFLGVSFSLLAIQHALAGVASTIMAIVPILIIPPAILIMKQKVSTKEIIGAVISVIGVAIFFI